MVKTEPSNSRNSKSIAKISSHKKIAVLCDKCSYRGIHRQLGEPTGGSNQCFHEKVILYISVKDERGFFSGNPAACDKKWVGFCAEEVAMIFFFF